MKIRLSEMSIILCSLLLIGGSCSRDSAEKEIIKDYRDVKFDAYDVSEIIRKERDKPFFRPEEDIVRCQMSSKAEDSGHWFPVDGGADPCYKRELGNYDALSMAFLSQEGLLPYIVVQRKGLTKGSKIKTGIFLIGGPQNSLRGFSETIYFSFASNLLDQYFDRVIFPAYYGTAHRDAFPRSDTEAAAAEILKFIDSFPGGMKKSRLDVSLIGFSGGSLVVNEIRERRPQISVVMISAPLDPIVNLPLGRPFSLYTASKRDQEYAALLVGGNGKHFGSLSIVKLLRPPLKLWYNNYFGPYFTDKSLRANLEQRAPCKNAVIGTRDNVISAKRYSFQGLRVKFIEGMEHTPQGNEFHQIATAVDQIIKCQNEMTVATE